MRLRWMAATVAACALAWTVVSAEMPWLALNAEFAQTGAACPANAKPAPLDFVLKDVTNKDVRLSDYKGKVILLDFWATWCTGCKVEIPWYVEFQKKYERRGLASIGAAMDEEGWPVVKRYLDAHPINYPIVLGNPELVKPYNIASLPVTLLIDHQGRIAASHAGVVEKDSWERNIQQLLKERKSHPTR
jgi:thiol-disulfide isomerase/thioredoxin